ncbi:MAG: hypothetical protein Q8K32_21320 [Archangium sp.]|nr:hypothetical protein [Archangium sp.]MDP3573502.1 hypothetical protein [Archangium sp.]
MSDVMVATGAGVETVLETPSGRTHQVTSSSSSESSPSTQNHVVRWLHQAAPALAALHSKWRLVRVEVEASWV